MRRKWIRAKLSFIRLLIKIKGMEKLNTDGDLFYCMLN